MRRPPQGAAVYGDNLGDVEMAKDVLCLWLYHKEEKRDAIPLATLPKNIDTAVDDFTSVIAVDTDDYRRYCENKLVKKTLNIPFWYNAKAEAAHINFSQFLQKALKETLKLPVAE